MSFSSFSLTASSTSHLLSLPLHPALLPPVSTQGVPSSHAGPAGLPTALSAYSSWCPGALSASLAISSPSTQRHNPWDSSPLADRKCRGLFSRHAERWVIVEGVPVPDTACKPWGRGRRQSLWVCWWVCAQGTLKVNRGAWNQPWGFSRSSISPCSCVFWSWCLTGAPEEWCLDHPKRSDHPTWIPAPNNSL